MRLKILKRSSKALRFSLAHTSIRALVSTKGHMIPRAPCIGIFAITVFNTMVKHTRILNRIVEAKISERRCQKTNNLGGGGTKCYSHPKNSVTRDDKHFNPFDTSFSITSTVSRYCPDLPSKNTLQTSVTETECKRNVGVTVAGARPSGASVLLKNRFQPLQMLMGDNYLEPQLEEVLQGLNNDKHSLSNAVNAKSIQSNVKPLLASQENVKTWWETKQIWVFGKGNS